jgi:transcriptional pleiotropic regulator of transition state genes
METNGILRHFDELGRISIPKDIRNQLGLGPQIENVPVEMFVRDGEVVIRPFRSPKVLHSMFSRLYQLIEDGEIPLSDEDKRTFVADMMALEDRIICTSKESLRT